MIDLTELNDIYSELDTQLKSTLNAQWDNNRLRGDAYAEVVAQSITAMFQTVASLMAQRMQLDEQARQADAELAEKIRVNDKQIESMAVEDALKNTQKLELELNGVAQRLIMAEQKNNVAKDTDTKQAQINMLVQQLSEATEKQPCNVANVRKQGVLLDKQATKLDADTGLVNTQAQAIEEQVIDNRRIKMIQVMGDTYGTVGAGGLTVSADMWTTFFTKLNDLDTISIPASKAVTKVT